MNKIEQLFGGDQAVPGMRPTGRVPSRPAIPGDESDLDTIEDLASEPVVEQLADDTVEDHASEAGEDNASDDGDESSQRFPVALVEPLRPGPQLWSAHDSGHPHSERIRMLRTQLLLRHRAQHGAMAIAVVGAGPGEGRSQLAAELALAFAQLNRSTLLLDADMRHPRQHEFFGAELRDGLAQAIVRGDSSTFFAVEGYPSLSLMTAGTCSTNPIELLSDGRFESLMDEMRENFEFIIVDTPRCADYADGIVIATVVGHVLSVHRARVSPFKATRTMLQQLASARADMLGAVLNQF
jgi:receptor protein-tyrosine kinase